MLDDYWNPEIMGPGMGVAGNADNWEFLNSDLMGCFCKGNVNRSSTLMASTCFGLV